MTHYVTLSDNDILSMDESTGNIVVDYDNMPSRVFEDDVVYIHYVEDIDSVQHKYIVKSENRKTSKVDLCWSEQLNEDLLTEAPNIFKKLKNVVNPDMETKIKQGEKIARRTQKKQESKFADLIKRDVSEGKAWNWEFYIQLPNKKNTKVPLTFNDVALFYKEGNNISPAILNAIVTTAKPDNFIMRKGKEDLASTGTRYSENETVSPQYSVEWTPEQVERFNELVINEGSDRLKKLAKIKNKKPDPKSDQKPEQPTEEPSQQGSSDEMPNKKDINKTIYSLCDLLYLTRLNVYDSNGEVIDTSNLPQLRNSITPDNLNTLQIEISGRKFPLYKWVNLAVKRNLLMENILTEAPVIKLSGDEMNNPDSLNLKDVVRRATEDESRAEEEKAIRAKQTELKEKYLPVYNELNTLVKGHNDTVDTLEFLFEKMVPSSGAAETVAGEYTRAMMRILYRDYNDGDKFFSGYGIETCGSSAEWLHDNGLLEEVESIVEDAYRLEDDDKYTEAITELADSVLRYLLNHEELFYKVNNDDSRDYTTEYIEGNQPKYEFECYGSDDIVTLVENGALSSWDLVSYVENVLSYERVYEGAECSRPWGHHDTSVTVENLTKEGYDYLSDSFERNVDSFWQDLVDEHADELDAEDEYDDFDYDDEVEED